MKRLAIFFLLGLLGIAGPAAAAVTATPVFCQTPAFTQQQFVAGVDAAGTYKTIFAGTANGSKVLGVIVTSNDGSLAHLVTVQTSTSATAHCSPQSSCGGGAAVTVPLSSGFATGVPAVNMFSPTNWPGLPRDSDGNPFLYLATTSQTLEATFATGLTASTQIAVQVFACAY